MIDKMKKQKLKEYLEGMRNCPDKWNKIGDERIHKLTVEYGIYDNYIILFKGDYEKIKEDFGKKSRKYKFFKEEREEETTIFKWDKKDKEFGYGDHKEKERAFLSNSGNVMFHIYNYVCIGHTTARDTDFEESGDKEEREHTEKQLKNYNMTMVFHPWNERKIKDISWKRTLADTISDICEYLINEKIPFCLPKSIGDAHEKDFSRIVYYDPEEDVK